ncbi:hypothetical protein AMJ49_00645 [Parcubacteria bacterium DG_74_2]|nr:MAG: hypothetical protein AMJ49_00645 [Parcubacteria bacterium DG_74_2]
MNLKINRVIKYLILSDLVLEASWGLISPIFAIFIIQKIQGGNAFVVGMASAIYLVVFSLIRIPVAIFLDWTLKEIDDFLFLLFGFFIVSFVPFGFIFSKFPWQIYFLQAIQGIGMAIAFSGYMAIFTKHIDKGKEATEWGIRASLIGLGTGLMAALGGILVTKFSFNLIFSLVGIFSLLGSLLTLFLKHEFLKK